MAAKRASKRWVFLCNWRKKKLKLSPWSFWESIKQHTNIFISCVTFNWSHSHVHRLLMIKHCYTCRNQTKCAMILKIPTGLNDTLIMWHYFKIKSPSETSINKEIWPVPNQVVSINYAITSIRTIRPFGYWTLISDPSQNLESFIKIQSKQVDENLMYCSKSTLL